MEPYYNEGITKTLDNPINLEAQKIFDPYMYRERLTMPKVDFSVKNIKKLPKTKIAS